MKKRAQNRNQSRSQNRPHKPSQQKTGKRQNSVGVVRIIGGDLRGRKLPVLDLQGLRPSADRTRETLFNWLQFDVPGSACLDLFAGSGALGFEAVSRGAKQVTMLELDRANAQQLKANAMALKLDNIELLNQDSLQLLKQSADNAFDIVFIDPPFNQGLVEPTFELLFKNGYVNEQSLIYLEQEKSLPWPELPAGWQCQKEKTTSQVRFGLFSKL